MIQIQNNSMFADKNNDKGNTSFINQVSQRANFIKLEKDFTKLVVFEERFTRNRKKTQYNHCNVLNEFKKLNQIPIVQLHKKKSDIKEEKKIIFFEDKDSNQNDQKSDIILISNDKEEIIKNESIPEDNVMTPKSTMIMPSMIQQMMEVNKMTQPNQKTGDFISSPTILNNSSSANIVDDHLSPMQIIRNFNLNPENNFGVVKKLFIYELKMSFLQAKKLCISLDLQGSSTNTKKKPTYYDLFSNYSQIITSTITTYDKYEDQNIKAVKITDKNSRMNKIKKKYDYVKEEVTILKRLHSKFVVQVFEILENEKEIFIVMEYLKKNSLFTKIKDLEGFQIWRYFRNIICGVEHCHEIGKIVHRDINVNNLLISSEDLLKLSDFGISAIIEEDNDLLSCNSGPSTYTPPEKIYGNSDYYHGKSADMWLIGVTLYHMVYKKPLFANFEDITQEDYQNIELPNEDSLDYMITDLISNLLQFNPARRPTFQDLKKNKWVTHNDEYPLPDIYEEAINYCYHITSKEIGTMFLNPKETNIIN